ncbi:hypothetical protein AVEN_51613-1 [Araneus ventricosus]|uniref:Secreted protein n=1 Tax=Araneus ventricosus TaxID=182803 RepID=A0A4Y2JUW9_ARAVE|nr:hypothetical protein AVEN_51613-1 [Araneus ventricosus]
MRSRRMNKRVLASLVGTAMVVWLLGPISDDGSYPGMLKRGRKTDEGREETLSSFEPGAKVWEKHIYPTALSSTCEGDFEAVVMEYRRKKGVGKECSKERNYL